MGRITVGISVAMTGLMLAQFAEENSQISLTVEEGSWFGKYQEGLFFICQENIKYHAHISYNIELSIIYSIFSSKHCNYWVFFGLMGRWNTKRVPWTEEVFNDE